MCEFLRDATGDGLITITDVLQWFLLYPGKFVICLTIEYAPDLALFLEFIGKTGISQTWSLILSLVFWFTAFITVFIIGAIVGGFAERPRIYTSDDND